MSLRRHLVVSFVLFALATLVATLIPFGVLSAHAHRSSFVDEQLDDAERAAVSLGRQLPSQQVVVERYSGRSVAAWLLDPRGNPTGEPTTRDAFPALITATPEIEKARAGTAEARIGPTPLGDRVLVAVPIVRGRQISGVLWVSASLAQVRRLDRQRWALLAGIGAAAMAGAALVGTRLARRLTRRLEVVTSGAVRFGSGRLDQRIEVGGSDEIAALAARLNDMAGEIERLVVREKSFVAAASHQIRTPLAAIKIRIDELLAAGRMDHDATEYLQEMSDEVDRLTALTSRLLDLSSAEQAPETRALVAGRAIREAVDRVAPLAQRHALSLNVTIDDEGATVRAPVGAFEEAVFNLLDNAVKFSHEGTPVDVRASLDNGSVIVEVADRGPGIPLEDRTRVLDPFYRAARTKPGYGLGLAISSRLCETAGATLGLDSREGGGTIASIRWPAAPRTTG